MSETIHSAIDFYERHPISAKIILSKVVAARGSLEGLVPDDLFAFDQDHYGDLAVNDILAERAGMAPGKTVVDFCAGLGGPARYFAHRYGVSVTGIELTPSRVVGAEDLSRRVGLSSRVRVIEGDVMAVPLGDASADIVVSQEALLHIPDLGRAFAEAHRILKPGGVFAFTNWTVPAPLIEADRQLMWDGMAVQPLYGPARQVDMLASTGFSGVTLDDISPLWRDVLVERLAMYQRLRTEAASVDAPAGHDAFYLSYVRFVDLIKSGGIGGGRFVAHKQRS